MPRFAVVTSHITTGDAVSNDVLAMQRVLANRGLDARIYAESGDFDEPKIWPLREIDEYLQAEQDVLIYHHSFGWEAGLELLQQRQGRTVIKYHNVTPPELFTGVSPWHEERCTAGRKHLEFIARADFAAYLSDSAYNSRELIALGAAEHKSFVVPPFHQIDRLDSVAADTDILETYRDGKTNLLSVSRVAPHKNQAALLDAFAIYHYDYNPNSRLIIVGRKEPGFKIYHQRLKELTRRYQLDDAIVFAGEVSEESLKAFYLLSSAFLLASKHEGFSVPIVEAMAMKVPVVSCAAAAIPETVGDAGIVLEDFDPERMAAAIDLVIRDESSNAALGVSGWRRYENRFTNAKIETQFLRALATLN
jgi:glycosyltransferase involved in cell wall biosynthesis